MDRRIKKELGQNFLVDKKVIDKIINLIDGPKNSKILEAGSGYGALTIPLAKKFDKITAIEIDKFFFDELNKSKISNLDLINEDFLKYDINSFLNKEANINNYFVSNLPYYVSTPILFRIISEKRFSRIYIMLQKELVDRITSKPNSKQYGRLSVSIGTFFDVKESFIVSHNSFYPKPKVDSGFLYLKRNDTNVEKFNIESYLEFIKTCFRFKRKTLLNNVKDTIYFKQTINYLHENSLNIKLRSEEISINNFVNIFNS